MEYVLQHKPVKKSRLTIGFLDENRNDEYQCYVTEGVYEAARKYDVNVIRMGHMAANDIYKHPFRTNMILEYVKQFDLDGLLFLGWASAAAFENHENFKKQFVSLPLFSLGMTYEDIPNVYFHGGQYIRELLLHLVNVHHFKRIAFVAPYRPDSRSDIYRETLEENEIYIPELYISGKELGELEPEPRGRKAVSLLLDDRKAAVDAIISISNAETEGVLNELRDRGVHVPRDMAVVSYEDGEVGRFFSPSFTTIYFPWKELGYTACEKFIELLTYGHVPLNTSVPGRVILRDSCGCMSNSVNLAKECSLDAAEKTIWEITGSEMKTVIDEITRKVNSGALDIEALIQAFMWDLKRKSGSAFPHELRTQLQKLPVNRDFSNVEDIVSIIRNSLLPYIINDSEELFLAEDIFQQAQVLVREKVLNVWGNKALQGKVIHWSLEGISQILIKNFSIQGLMDSLEANLPLLNIPGCYIFIFNHQEDQGSLFENCTLAFEYSGNARVKSKAAKPCSARQKLSEVLFPENRPYAMMANLLHVNDEFTGFAVYETGPADERVYQALSTHISTALNAAILFEKLDTSYKRLVENAHKEGMTNIATGILHNIRNILNSINTSVYLMRDLINASLMDEFIMANRLLEKNMDNLQDFICNDAKGKKLMQFYIKLGDPLTNLKDELVSNINRVDEKTGLINDILSSQQSYEGSGSMMEEFEIAGIVEDALKMNLSSLQKYGIRIVRHYADDVKVKVQKTKLFQVLMNVIKNAKESMMEANGNSRVLTLTVDEDKGGKYIRIADTGCGIPGSTLKSVFAYGFTTKKDGHGYGLHSCANHMTEMGGKMWAESEGAGKGATFVLHFPIE